MATPKPYSTHVARSGGRGHRSLDEYRWWKATWDKRPVIVERPFDVHSFQIDELPQKVIIYRNEWETYLMDANNTCNNTICTEFLASLLPVPNEPYSWQSHVRTMPVYLNPTTLGAIMDIEPRPAGSFLFPYQEIPADPSPDMLASRLAKRRMTWPLNHEGFLGLFDRSLLHPSLDTLWMLICNSLMPTSQHTKINLAHARVMDAIMRDQPFCLVRFFIDQIASIYESTNMRDAIKMGVLITKLCEEAGVVAESTDSRTRQLSICNQRMLNRRRGQLKNRQQEAPGVQDEAEEEQAREAGEGSSQPAPSQVPRQRRRAAAGAVPLDMDVLTGRLDEMHAMNQSQFTSLAEDSQRHREQYLTDYGSLRTEVAAIRDQQAILGNRMGYLEGRVETMANDMLHGFNTLEDRMYEILSRLPPPPPPDQ